MMMMMMMMGRYNWTYVWLSPFLHTHTQRNAIAWMYVELFWVGCSRSRLLWSGGGRYDSKFSTHQSKLACFKWGEISIACVFVCVCFSINWCERHERFEWRHDTRHASKIHYIYMFFAVMLSECGGTTTHTWTTKRSVIIYIYVTFTYMKILSTLYFIYLIIIYYILYFIMLVTVRGSISMYKGDHIDVFVVRGFFLWRKKDTASTSSYIFASNSKSGQPIYLTI